MTRQRPFEAAQPFSYLELEAFCRVSQTPLSPWQVDAIMEMDIHRRNALQDAARAATGVPGVRRTVSMSDTDAFERMFDGFGDVVDA